MYLLNEESALSEQLWAESLYQTFYEQKNTLNIITLYGS